MHTPSYLNRRMWARGIPETHPLTSALDQRFGESTSTITSIVKTMNASVPTVITSSGPESATGARTGQRSPGRSGGTSGGDGAKHGHPVTDRRRP
ncbi:hypothetical protein FAIPA1_380033 [Frankia sp. AiPs1]